MLQNEYSVAKIGFGTAEKESSNVCCNGLTASNFKEQTYHHNCVAILVQGAFKAQDHEQGTQVMTNPARFAAVMTFARSIFSDRK